MARPLKLNPELQAKLLTNLEGGLPYNIACASAGLHYDTFRRYMVRGAKAKRGRFRAFFVAVKAAEERAMARLMVNWQAQAPQDWKAARSYLARRWPAELGHLEPLREKNGGNGNGNGHGGAVGAGNVAAERPIIQILSAIPRPERPTVPVPTLAERMAERVETPVAGAPAPEVAPPAPLPGAPAPMRDLGI